MKQINFLMITFICSVMIKSIYTRSVVPDCSYLGEKTLTNRFQRCIRRLGELQEIITLLCNFRRPEGTEIQTVPRRQIGDLFCECCHKRCSRRKLMSHCS